eukprot:m.285497 g.285497  ORF g.285497 m.285497 type:complete len:680 (+) comp54972_c0_seq1:34-2073(+)
MLALAALVLVLLFLAYRKFSRAQDVLVKLITVTSTSESFQRGRQTSAVDFEDRFTDAPLARLGADNPRTPRNTVRFREANTPLLSVNVESPTPVGKRNALLASLVGRQNRGILASTPITQERDTEREPAGGPGAAVGPVVQRTPVAAPHLQPTITPAKPSFDSSKFLVTASQSRIRVLTESPCTLDFVRTHKPASEDEFPAELKRHVDSLPSAMSEQVRLSASAQVSELFARRRQNLTARVHEEDSFRSFSQSSLATLCATLSEMQSRAPAQLPPTVSDAISSYTLAYNALVHMDTPATPPKQLAAQIQDSQESFAVWQRTFDDHLAAVKQQEDEDNRRKQEAAAKKAAEDRLAAEKAESDRKQAEAAAAQEKQAAEEKRKAAETEANHKAAQRAAQRINPITVYNNRIKLLQDIEATLTPDMADAIADCDAKFRSSLNKLSRSNISKIEARVCEIIEQVGDEQIRRIVLSRLATVLAARSDRCKVDADGGNDDAFLLGFLVVLLAARYGELVELWLASMVRSCPLLVPCFPEHYVDSVAARTERPSMKVWYEEMESHARFLAAVIQTTHPSGVNPFSPEIGWQFLSRTLNSAPISGASPAVLNAFLIVAGEFLVSCYGLQMQKILVCLHEQYVPLLERETAASGRESDSVKLDSFKRQFDRWLRAEFPLVKGREIQYP